MLLALTVLWGSAFLLTKIAVGGVPPQLVAAARLIVAASILVPLALVARKRLAGGPRLWLFLAMIAVFGNALPFTIISWGQQSIDSGLAGILMATMPLGTLVLGHFLLPGERLTWARIGGFALGFTGVIVLIGPRALGAVAGGGELIAMLAIVAGAMSYALASVLARLRPASDDLASAAAIVCIAALLLSPIAVGDGIHLVDADATVHQVTAVVVLGLFSTALAMVIYLKLVRSAGPAFVSQLNYLIPLWSVLLGMIFLGERPTVQHLVALVLILSGVLLGTRRPHRPQVVAAAEPAFERQP